MTTTNPLTLFATTNYRGDRRPFGIRDSDRLLHFYTLGRTGSGKSTLLETFMRRDLERGHGFALLDPHGDLADRVLDLVPASRVDDVVYLNPGDTEHPVPFNVLEKVDSRQRHLIASGVVTILKRLWEAFWGPSTEYIVRNSVLALAEAPETTLLHINRLLIDRPYRDRVLRSVADPAVRQFWLGEYAGWSNTQRAERIAPVQNKVGEFLTTPLVRNILGQRNNLFRIRKLMDEGKILVVNLAKGTLGEDISSLLGSLVLTHIMLATFSRTDIPEAKRRPFFLYADEFHSFGAHGVFATLLSEARKFGLGMVLANQYLEQLDRDLRSAIFGNVGTFVSFRAGAEDAPYLEREFSPTFSREDLVGLPKYEIYLRLAVHGVPSASFSGITLPPVRPLASQRDAIIARTRRHYARPRHVVEEGAAQQFLGTGLSDGAGARSNARSSRSIAPEESRSPF